MITFAINPMSGKVEIVKEGTGGSGSPSNPISITAANFLIAYNNQFVPASPVLVEGYYLITDQCEVGLLIQTAKDKNGVITPALQGIGFYDNPDFQDVGNYSNLTIPKGTNWGVWYQGLELTTITYDTLAGGTFSPGDTITEPTNGAVGICITDDGVGVLTLVRQTPTHFFVAGNSINNGMGVSANELNVTRPVNAIVLGDIVFWNGFHYQLIDDTAIDGTDPAANTTAYLKKLKGTNANVGYIRCACDVEYDFRNNWIQKCSDERGNVITDPSAISNSSISLFQFGNDSVYGNIINAGSVWGNINNRGAISSSVMTGQGNCATDNTNVGVIAGVIIETCILTINKDGGRSISDCSFKNITATIKPSVDEVNMSAVLGEYSTFPCTIAIIGLTTLDITGANNYCGLINLTSTNAAETLDTIRNRPQVPFQLQFGTSTLATFTLTGTAAVAMASNKIALTAATFVAHKVPGDTILLKSDTLNSASCSSEVLRRSIT